MNKSTNIVQAVEDGIGQMRNMAEDYMYVSVMLILTTPVLILVASLDL